jgi:hypothetical protein
VLFRNRWIEEGFEGEVLTPSFGSGFFFKPAFEMEVSWTFSAYVRGGKMVTLGYYLFRIVSLGGGLRNSSQGRQIRSKRHDPRPKQL